MYYAIDNGARVVNFSAGVSYYTETFYDALVAALNAGVLFVASAGNDAVDNDETPHYPASYDLDSVISVAATDNRDNLAYFSNWGATSVDLGAPGLYIRSTQPPITPVFYEDFDSATPPDIGDQFTLEGPTNFWGTIDAGNGNITARGDAEHSSPYRPEAEGWIVTPPIDTTEMRGLSMFFIGRCQMEEYYDALTAGAWDGAAWQEKFRVTEGFTNPDPRWWWTRIDLKLFRNSAMRLRFGWQTDETENDYYGAEIDEVLIQHVGSDYTGESAYGSMSGTSTSAPHVVGAAALLLAHNPDMCLKELRNRLIWSGDPLSTLDGITVSGRRLNVYNALTAPSELAVLNPNGGEHWLLGSSRVIGWSKFNCDLPDTVDIYLLEGGVVHSQLADDVPNTGSFLWTVPEGLPIAQDYRIRVDDGTIIDESDADFSLRPAGSVLHVDDDAPEGGDGMSWDTAYRHLQDALTAATIGDEIRVAGGIYKPDLDEGGMVTPGDRGATFVPAGSVKLYGGYAGLANPGDPDLRDLTLYESVLSGDLAGDDGPAHVEQFAACCIGIGIPASAECKAFDVTGSNVVTLWNFADFLIENHYTENSYHVLTGAVTAEPAVVDGFTVVAGYASGDVPYHGDLGGGMYNPTYSSPVVSNCTFRGNAAYSRGGGMYNRYLSSPTVTDCRFVGNVARAWGGGMRSQDVGNLTLSNCAFSENVAMEGGGMSLSTDNANLNGCTFAGNNAHRGGGMYNSGDSTLVNCAFQGNLASAYEDSDSLGGGLYTIGDPVLTNCTFSANSAIWTGGAIYNSQSGKPTLTNCLLWDDEPNEIANAPDSIPVVTYSNVQGGTGRSWFGLGCIDADPLFIDPDGPDEVTGTMDDNVHLWAGSPCIDAGNDSAVLSLMDLDGKGRILDGDDDGTSIVDMGVYEFAADCNSNGIPDENDLAAGTSPDCNANDVPDECEPGGANDCNVNGITDWCDVQTGPAEDCNTNWIPDECDIINGSSNDCNFNDSPDACDIADGVSEDCNGNYFPDECDVSGGASNDCNVNDLPDECDISDGASDDCNDNGVPDECDVVDPGIDCNVNGIPDQCDIADETSQDCNSSGVPDECEPGALDDCNTDGTTDWCEIQDGLSPDCNGNWSPDECDLSDGTSENCNSNAIPDECEPGGLEDCNDTGIPDLCDLHFGDSRDCNRNSIPDECDVGGGTSPDENTNGVPDECECVASSAAEPELLSLPGAPISRKVRYLSFSAGDEVRLQAIRLTFVDIPTPYDHWIGTQLWVQQPVEYCENSGVPKGEPCPTVVGGLSSSTFWGAWLGCDPYWGDWTQYGQVHVWDEGIIPHGVYDVQVIDSKCSTEAEVDYSVPLTLTQSGWSDLVQDCTTTPCGPPEGSTGIVDVTAVLDKWKNLPGNVKKVRADIEGSPSGDHRIPNQTIDITDVTYCLGAFLGDTYPPPGFPPPRDPPTCP